jgi:hypothetical protein
MGVVKAAFCAMSGHRFPPAPAETTRFYGRGPQLVPGYTSEAFGCRRCSATLLVVTDDGDPPKVTKKISWPGIPTWWPM